MTGTQLPKFYLYKINSILLLIFFYLIFDDTLSTYKIYFTHENKKEETFIQISMQNIYYVNNFLIKIFI